MIGPRAERVPAPDWLLSSPPTPPNGYFFLPSVLSAYRPILCAGGSGTFDTSIMNIVAGKACNVLMVFP